MLRPLDISPDWKVDVTFEARAAFYRPTDIKGRGWVSTAGVKGGGKVSLPSISMHSALICSCPHLFFLVSLLSLTRRPFQSIRKMAKMTLLS